MFDHLEKVGEDGLFVFSLGYDVNRIPLMYHRVHGWPLFLSVLGLALRACEVTDTKLDTYFLEGRGKRLSSEDQLILRERILYLRENYIVGSPLSDAELRKSVTNLVGRLPEGSKAIFLVESERRKNHGSEEIYINNKAITYYDLMKQFLAETPWARVISISDYLGSDNDIINDDHYSRQVYQKLAKGIADTANDMPGREATAKPATHVNIDLVPADAETVEKLFQTILGRPIRNDQFKAANDGTNSIRYWVQRLVNSEEFKKRFMEKHGVLLPSEN